MKSRTLPDAKATTKSDETDESDTQTLSPGTVHSMTPEKDEIATTIPTSLESRISTLKRTTGNSGMSADRGFDLDICGEVMNLVVLFKS
ncbi:hypothetical protein ACTXT7_004767 [Hymenolepis weldensis]